MCADWTRARARRKGGSPYLQLALLLFVVVWEATGQRSTKVLPVARALRQPCSYSYNCSHRSPQTKHTVIVAAVDLIIERSEQECTVDFEGMELCGIQFNESVRQGGEESPWTCNETMSKVMVIVKVKMGGRRKRTGPWRRGEISPCYVGRRRVTRLAILRERHCPCSMTSLWDGGKGTCD